LSPNPSANFAGVQGAQRCKLPPPGGLGANFGPHFDAGQRLALRCVCAWVAFVTLLAFAASAHAEELPTDGAQIGQASWYGQDFARRRTASGEEFDPQVLTGAHRTLPLGSKVRVTNLHNGRSVLVTINDRGRTVTAARSTCPTARPASSV
jgi:hypothetical protein